MLSIFYISAMITFITLVIFIAMSGRKVLFYNASFFMFILLANLGNLFVALSKNAEEALLANKIVYFCGCALPIFLIMLVCDCCKITVSKLGRMFMYGYNCFVMGMAMTTGMNTFFYKSYDIKKINGVTVLVKEYGPGHNFFLIMLYGYMIVALGILVYSILKRKNLIYKDVLIMVLIYVNTILCYTIGRKILKGIDPICISYAINGVLMLFITYDTSLYNIDEALLASTEKQNNDGYILLDRKFRIFGTNEIALDFIPELEKAPLAKRLDVSLNPLICEIERIVSDFEKDNSKTGDAVSVNGQDVAIAVQHLYRGNSARGYIVRIEDDSKVQGYIRQLNAVSKNKSDFLSNVSHEIRTPINSVLGMNEMIIRESQEENILEYAESIENSGKTLLQLINDVLDLSKIESGKFEVVCDNYELADLLRELEDLIHPLVEKSGLQFNVVLSDNLPKGLYGDKVRIKQMVINILTNSVKYTEKGSITFSVAGVKSGDDFIFRYSVKDTGKGIRPEDIGVLFSAFERVDLKKNSGIEGTGLGLAITKKFALMMGGDIEVESTYGEGSEFIIKVPQKVVNSEFMGDYHEDHKKVKKDKYVPAFEAKDVKMLVVDDVKMNLTVVKLLLKETKMQIEPCSSGKACIERVKEEKYDIILLDHMMPDLDGVDTLKIIRDEHYCDDTPVIALTANVSSDAKDRYSGYGFTDYLAKPIDPVELEKMIFKYLPEEKVVKKN